MRRQALGRSDWRTTSGKKRTEQKPKAHPSVLRTRGEIRRIIEAIMRLPEEEREETEEEPPI